MGAKIRRPPEEVFFVLREITFFSRAAAHDG
jgi:hypothetical protein